MENTPEGALRSYAGALNKALEIFFSYAERTVDEVLSHGLRPVADAADMDRIIVFRILEEERNIAGEIYRWDRIAGGTAPVDEALKRLPIGTAVERWLARVSKDACISLRRSEFTEDEAAFLVPRGVRSILIVPVFTKSAFWGVVTFHDNRNERDFDGDCTQMLRSAARLCVDTLIRDEMEHEIIETRVMRETEERMRILRDAEKDRFEAMAHWYESLLDAMPFLVTAQDLEQRFTFLNAAAEDTFGKSRSTLVGEPCRKLGLSVCDTDQCAIRCAKRGRTRTYFTRENASYQADIKSLKDISGKAIGYIEVIQDITKMEHMARQQAEAEAASHAKSSFLSAMSHEIRTPLNAVIGMTAVGKNAADLARKDYALNKIEEASRHLLGVINDVLDMSKIEANRLELTPVEFDLNETLQKAVFFIHFAMEQKGLQFTMNVDPHLPSFFVGDDQRLTQVITNLLSNAVKFTPEGGTVCLDVAKESEENGVCELRFSVTDSGIGLSGEQQQKLFRPFEQADRGIRRKYGGTGLGLVISKHIIGRFGGRIWVESEPGRGARFNFTVKLARDETGMESLSRGKSGDLASGAKNRLAGKIILLAEDIDINREILITLLDGTGLLIDTAENGKEAFEMVKDNPDRYDLVFMDIQMPEMDGLEATRRIRALESPRCKRLPIIAMTANVFQRDIDECLAEGMNGHIGKPFDVAVVLEALLEYIP